MDQNITKVDLTRSIFQVSTVDKNYEAKSIIIATGAKALWLGLPSETRLRGKGVSACATCDGFFFRNKIVAVVGGGDTAMEDANTLTKFAAKVYLIHRRDSFRASKIMQGRVLSNPKVEVIYNTVVEDIIGNNRVEGVKIKSQIANGKPESKILKLDGLFVAIGHKPDTELFKGQVEMDEKEYIMTSGRKALEIVSNGAIGQLNNFIFEYQTMTSVTGVFAAGDNIDHVYRQAGTAAGMGIAAAIEAERYLDGL